MDNRIMEKKYAVIIDDNRITDYCFDEVKQTDSTIYGIKIMDNASYEIHAYLKENGKLVFRMEKVCKYEFFLKGCIIKLVNLKEYIYFDERKKVVGPFFEVNALSCDELEVAKIHKDNKGNTKKLYGIYNADGKIFLPIKYSYILFIADRFIEVGLNGNSGLISYAGKCILKPIYPDITYYSDYKFIVFYDEQKDSYGAINQNGDILLECEYDDIQVDEEKGVVYILKDALYGMCKFGQGVIYTPTFRHIERQGEVIELMTLDHKVYGYIPKLDLLLPRSCYTYYKNYLKYFDGYKWRKLKYNKK